MSKKIKAISLVVLGVLVSSCVAIGSIYNVSARTVTQIQTSIMDKAVYEGVFKCYANGYINSSIDPLSNYTGIESLISSANSGENYVPLITGVKSSSIWSTNRYQVADSGLSCKQLFKGGSYSFGGNNYSLLTATGHTAPNRNSSDQVISFMEGMGYTVTKNGNDKCYSIAYTSNGKDGFTNSICQSSDGSLYDNGAKRTGFESTIKFELSGKNKMCLVLPDPVAGSKTYGNCTTYSNGFSFNGEWLLSVIKTACGSMNCKYTRGTNHDGTKTDYNIVFDAAVDDIITQDSLANSSAKFANNLGTVAGMKAVRYLSGNENYKSRTDITIDDVEKRVLYQAYLTSYYGVTVDCAEGVSDSAYDGTINWFDSGSSSVKTCHYSLSGAKNKNKPVNGVGSDGFLAYESISGMDSLISEINKLPTSYTEEQIADMTSIMDGDIEGDVQQNNDGEAVCKANAGVLGWILCPIIKAISGIGEHMWNQVEQNHLKIQAREMFVNNTGVKDAFDVVRNISNIAFIILFMFVIFSQLTGVGIDNYGIKRILPRLIMVAILTNLSYYICEAAVDISNIFGAGLNDMLTGFANNIGYGNDSMGALAGGLAIDGLLAGGGIAIFLTLNPVTATGAVMGAISVAFAVFGVIVSIVAAMLVLYLIVVIREAAIIIMVVLAPVAIVCYALPNTEKIYKRWFDIFKALLIVYPICGAMVGAGRLAAAVLGQINTQSMAIAAMIVQVIPFFLIPMLLKNSLAALGNIGAKISNAGRSLSRRASGAVTNGIRNSARFKDFEQFQKDKITAERAGKVAKALENRARKRGGVENLSLRDQDRLAKAHAAQEARKAYERRTKMGAREDYHEFREKNMDAAFDSERGKMYAQNFEYETDRSRLEDAFDSGIDGADAEYAVAAMEALINRGGIKEAMNIVRKKKNFDWNSDMGKRLAQAMGGTNVDAFQAYSKYRGKGGKVGFDDWLRGADHGNKNIKEVSSYADHLRARGVKSMAKYSKDEMEFIKDNYSAISAGMGTAEREEFRGDLAGMVNWAAINSDDAKVSRMAEQVLTQELTYGTEDVSGNKTYGISSVRDLGLTAGSIGQMKGTTMQAILKGYEQRIASNQEYASLGQEKITELAMQALRNDLAPQIKAIESDVRIKNNTSGDVLSILGIRGGPNDIPDTSVPLRQETPTPKPNNSPAPSSSDGWYFDNYGGGSKT